MIKRLTFVAVLLVLTGCNGATTPDTQDTANPSARLEAKTIEAGEVTVKIEPVRIDDSGARFDVILDTHSVELDMDLEKDASLEVDGTRWTGARWKGDGPSGHHREGTLTFEASREAKGTARLSLDGFPEPVDASWDLADA